MSEWSWQLTATASDDLDGLEPDERKQIVEKLDEICSSPWRDPPDYGAPLQNSPHKKIRIGRFRLAVKFYHGDKVLLGPASSPAAARTPPTEGRAHGRQSSVLAALTSR